MKTGNLDPMNYMPVGTKFIARYPDDTYQLCAVSQRGGTYDGERVIFQWIVIDFINHIPKGCPVLDYIFDHEQAANGEKYPYILSFAD